ncbi:glucokinase [Entomortierella chlamydospora]|uniref:Phosphotransferase n=1 Tax=Entomortierella chlamydospora TaxID=101097 RepID=A0A9P6N7P2_9FUNG|nr:glucokinase [Entomortierella chlamydospora]KAG0024836.1 glucokinase [Entomortierella chlamydospora]
MTKSIFQETVEQFVLSKDQVQKIINGLTDELVEGLSTKDPKNITQQPSFITRLPTGHETGLYLAIDMGGTNLRTAAVHLLGDGQVGVTMQKHEITHELKTGTGQAMFDWIADCTAGLLKTVAIDMGDAELQMGVTFSFAIQQTAINRGKVLAMGKGFDLSDVMGHDLKDLLEGGFARKNLNVKVSAIINDTVGTLVSHAYVSPSTKIGVILATGTNAAYIERASEVSKYNGPTCDQMILNTEWDAMGKAEYLPQTKYDKEIDAVSLVPGFQEFEKMISGLYMGELVRLALVDLIERNAILEFLGGKVPESLSQRLAFKTLFMSTIESDHSSDHAGVDKVFKTSFGIEGLTPEDRARIFQLIHTIGKRSATMTAAACVALLQKANGSSVNLDDPNEITTIGIDGSVFEKYPHFSHSMMESLIEIMGQDRASRIRLELARDGGCIGAALVAMVSESGGAV